MSDLPPGWALTTLDTVATWGSGGTPSRSHPEYYGGPIPWIKTGELGTRTLTKTEETITELGLESSSAKVFPEGSIALAMYGATIGKASILGIDAATNQACAVGIPIAKLISREYLYYYLISQRQDFVASGQGGAQPNISQAIVKQWPFPLAPLNEQKRIANKLELLLSRADSCREHLDRAPQILDRFREAVLSAAVSGELTAKWRDQNGGAGTWRNVELRDVASDFSYGSSAKSAVSGTTPVLRMGNIQDGQLDWSDLVFTSDSQEIDKYRLLPGDVLFNRTNSPELVGKTAVYMGEREAVYAGYLIRVRCTSSLLPDFLGYALNSPSGRDYCWRVKSDGVSQSNINAQKLKDFAFRLPPIDEQKHIVRVVTNLLRSAEKAKMIAESVSQRLDHCERSLFSVAFRGELVAQDPTDEPASELLERIKSSRAETNQSTPKRRTAHRNLAMSKLTKDSLKASIRALPNKSFTFEELRLKAPAEYEVLKDLLFQLLDEPRPLVRQVFDKKEQSIRLERQAL